MPAAPDFPPSEHDAPVIAPDEDAPEGDLYAALGLTPAASEEAVRRAFRAQAKRWHPDRFATAAADERDRAERRIRAVIAAYAVLGNPLRRAAYDRRHGYQFARPPTMSAAGPMRYAYDTVSSRPHERAHNPNGAGQLAGSLCLILAIALLGRTLAGDSNGGWGTIALFGVTALLFAMAAIFFNVESPAARAANAYMEGEPRPAGHTQTDFAPDEHWGGAEGDAEASGADFEAFVEEALESVPDEFRAQMANVVVQVEEEPSEEDLRRADVPPGGTLLGLYHGVPLTLQGAHGAGPEYISIYRGPIERHCGHDPEAIREQVIATVLHELAHHFGIDHDDMPEWVK